MIGRVLIFIMLMFLFNSCWFVNYYDKEEAVEEITKLYEENQNELEGVFDDISTFNLEPCQMYCLVRGSAVDYYELNKIPIDSSTSISRFDWRVMSQKPVRDSSGNEIHKNYSLPRINFSRISIVPTLAVAINLTEVMSERFIEDDFNDYWLIRFISKELFCEFNRQLCNSPSGETKTQYLIALKNDWYILESPHFYTIENWKECVTKSPLSR